MAEVNAYGVGVIAFLALSVIVGTLTAKLVKKSSRRYMVAGKSLPLLFVGTMLAAQSIDGNSSLGNASLVYQFGFWAGAAIPIGLAVCLILTGAFYAKRLNKMAMLTLIDFFWAMLITSLVVLVYTFAGGLFSSAYTDIFQIYLAIGAFWAAFIFFAAGLSGVDFGTILGNAPPEYLDLSGLFDIGNGALVNWGGILALALGDLVALDFMERVFAAKDGKTAQRGALMGGALTLSTVIPTSMIGIIALYFLPNIGDPFTVFPELAINHMPFAIGVAMLMGVLGASMSTANGGLLAISSVMSRNIIQRDILRRVLKRPGMDDRRLLMTTRIFTIPMMIAAFVLAYLLPQPGVYLILAFDIVFAGAWAPLTLGLFWKRANMPAALSSLIVGSALRLVMFFVTPIEYAGIDTMIPPVVSFVLFVGVAFATQKKYPGRPGIINYVPPEEDVVKGEDLKGYVDPGGRKLQ